MFDICPAVYWETTFQMKIHQKFYVTLVSVYGHRIEIWQKNKNNVMNTK